MCVFIVGNFPHLLSHASHLYFFNGRSKKRNLNLLHNFQFQKELTFWNGNYFESCFLHSKRLL